MKKLIISSVMAFALLASMPLAAQNAGCPKTKTECPQAKKDCSKQKDCPKKAKCDKEAKPACCPKAKK